MHIHFAQIINNRDEYQNVLQKIGLQIFTKTGDVN